MPESLWSKRELAEFLGVSVRAVERMAIPRVALRTIGSKKPIVRYDPEQVRAWLDAQRSRPLKSIRKAS